MKKHGFTLIEILIAFTILTLLALLGFMAWQNQAAKARDARRKADIKRLNIAFEDYYADAQAYPPADILRECGGAQLRTYLDGSIPCDPLTHTPYCYIYDSEPLVGQEFRILASLENDSDPDIGKLGCASTTNFCGYENQCNAFGGSGFNFGFSSTNIAVLEPNTPFDSGHKSPSPSAGAGASPSPSASPFPSASCYPGGGQYIYACDSLGICNIWDHFPPSCCFSSHDNCDNMCSNPTNWCTN
jgi:prepilin-type N-terminal cleavage/methylation domain-containing protein